MKLEYYMKFRAAVRQNLTAISVFLPFQLF